MFYKIENNYFSAEISSIGAELHSFKSKIDDIEYIWQGDDSIWSSHAPILFPIVGQLLNGRYKYNGIEYYLPKHGFLRKKKFRVLSIEDNFASFMFDSNEETKSVYPFDFELHVNYKIKDNKLKVIYEVINKNEGVMYFSIGAHPGFNCNIGDNLVFEKKETLSTMRLDENLIITNEKVPILNQERVLNISSDIFNSDALIFTDYKSSIVTLKKIKDGHSVVIDYGNAPYLALWSKPGAPFVCIGPWYGINDNYEEKSEISEKNGIQKLNKGERFRQIWSAKINIL